MVDPNRGTKVCALSARFRGTPSAIATARVVDRIVVRGSYCNHLHPRKPISSRCGAITIGHDARTYQNVMWARIRTGSDGCSN